jgi:ribosome maturation factor RimP
LLDVTLQQLLAPAITALGYELFAVERLPQGRHSSILRVYIDSPDGITIDDCERVSYQVSGILDVEDPIRGSYTLEVSSPGLDRPLFTLDHFLRFVGHKIHVKLTQPLDSRRHFTGTLQRVDGHTVTLQTDDIEYNFPYPHIDKARLVPDDQLLNSKSPTMR